MKRLKQCNVHNDKNNPRCPRCKRQLVCREIKGEVWSCPVHWRVYFDVRKGGKIAPG